MTLLLVNTQPAAESPATLSKFSERDVGWARTAAGDVRINKVVTPNKAESLIFGAVMDVSSIGRNASPVSGNRRESGENEFFHPVGEYRKREK
jgi:hypothetical protein